MKMLKKSKQIEQKNSRKILENQSYHIVEINIKSGSQKNMENALTKRKTMYTLSMKACQATNNIVNA